MSEKDQKSTQKAPPPQNFLSSTKSNASFVPTGQSEWIRQNAEELHNTNLDPNEDSSERRSAQNTLDRLKKKRMFFSKKGRTIRKTNQTLEDMETEPKVDLGVSTRSNVSFLPQGRSSWLNMTKNELHERDLENEKEIEDMTFSTRGGIAQMTSRAPEISAEKMKKVVGNVKKQYEDSPSNIQMCLIMMFTTIIALSIGLIIVKKVKNNEETSEDGEISDSDQFFFSLNQQIDACETIQDRFFGNQTDAVGFASCFEGVLCEENEFFLQWITQNM